jgi:hypothetical protein
MQGLRLQLKCIAFVPGLAQVSPAAEIAGIYTWSTTRARHNAIIFCLGSRPALPRPEIDTCPRPSREINTHLATVYFHHRAFASMPLPNWPLHSFN